MRVDCVFGAYPFVVIDPETTHRYYVLDKKKRPLEDLTDTLKFFLTEILYGRFGRCKSPFRLSARKHCLKLKPEKKLLPAPTKQVEDINLEGFDELFEQEYELHELVKVAVSILTWPIAQLSRPDRFKPHRVVKQGIIQGGKSITIVHEVTPNPELGMPTMFSLKLLFFILKIADEFKTKTGSIPKYIPIGTWNQICKALGMKGSYRNRKMIQNHLQIWHSTVIGSQRAFKTQRDHEGVSDKFILIPSIRWKGEVDEGQIPNDQTYVALSEHLLAAIENNYVKTLDLQLMAEVKTDIAQLLYTKISYLLQKASRKGKEETSVQYEWLVERMGLKSHSTLWRAKQQLNPAFEQLVKLKYIQQHSWDGWNIILKPDVRFTFGEQLQLQQRKDKITKAPKSLSKSVKTTHQPKQLSLPINTDPLYGLCSVYAENGWEWAKKHASKRGLTEEQLKEETLKRNIEIK